MPIFEFICQNKECKELHEEYFHTFEQAPEALPCSKCGGAKRRILGRAFVRAGGEVPGYERENADQLTVGKAIDGRQKWV